jgi:hypothetical protein
MDAKPPLPREIWNLVDELLNGRIEPAGREQLESYLLKHEDARGFFTAYCQLHVDVVMDQHSEHVIRSFLADRESAPGGVLAVREESGGVETDASNAIQTTDANKITRRGMRRISGAWALAASLLVCSFAIWTATRERAPNAAISGVVVDGNHVRLAIADVGTVFLEDSADFSIVGPNRARLARGRIKMRVTEVTGHGFVVETPYGEVADNGTEFGLDVDEKGQSSCVVVFDGSVDLNVKNNAQKGAAAQPQRLLEGEGVVFYDGGRTDRVNSICSGRGATFHRDAGSSTSIISEVSDNLDPADTKKFYDIVAGGLQEDVLAYVDRPHQWNGVTTDGIPKYLLNADYVRTFSDDRILKKLATDDRILKKLEIKVTLTRPATLYIFSDKRFKQPRWLQTDFVRTGDMMGIDIGRWGTNKKRVTEVGPGNSINAKFDVWKREVREPGVVVLGAPFESGRNDVGGMYGIAATPLDVPDSAPPAANANSTEK